MKYSFRFHTLVILMVVLTFSAPFVTLAQQNTTQPEVPKDTTQDVNAIKLAAKVDAEQDASNDHNKYLSIGMGACVPILSLATGLVGAIAFAGESNGGWFGYGFGINPYAFLGGAALTGLASYWAIYSLNSEPPALRLIGKTPEYVEAYTDAYKKKMRSLRMMWSAVGTGGCLIMPAIL